MKSPVPLVTLAREDIQHYIMGGPHGILTFNCETTNAQVLEMI